MIEQLLARSRDGVARLESATQALVVIQEQNQMVRALMDSLHDGCRGQTEGLARLNHALHGAGEATEHAAKTASESAAEAEELAQASDSLEECVAALNRMMGVSGARARRPPEGPGL